mmetsp:Transcript_12604/g.27588  ORF Transcript_12604/g.27588 Transcript_12604/m.27588 type:complete len:231 (-) Transcript_12604:1328-2020(-)
MATATPTTTATNTASTPPPNQARADPPREARAKVMDTQDTPWITSRPSSKSTVTTTVMEVDTEAPPRVERVAPPNLAREAVVVRPRVGRVAPLNPERDPREDTTSWVKGPRAVEEEDTAVDMGTNTMMDMLPMTIMLERMMSLENLHQPTMPTSTTLSPPQTRPVDSPLPPQTQPVVSPPVLLGREVLASEREAPTSPLALLEPSSFLLVLPCREDVVLQSQSLEIPAMR